jgi:putative peptidoglycan lipid II flippase
MPFFLIDGLYTRGQFHAVDAHQTALALRQYGWGAPAFVLAALYSRAFFARQDTRTPMYYGLVSVVVNVVAGFTLFRLVGVAGIAAATSLASWVNVGLMAATLARRGAYSPSPAAWSRLVRIVLASGVLGALLAFAARQRAPIERLFGHAHLGHAIGAKELAILLVTVLAGVVYPVILLGVGGISRAEVMGAVRRKP